MYPVIESFMIFSLFLVDLSLPSQHCTMLSRRIEINGNREGFVVIALGFSKLVEDTGNITQATERSTIDLLCSLLMGNSLGLFIHVFRCQVFAFIEQDCS